MKKDVRFLGFDDSPFRFGDESVRIVGVVTRGASYIEGVMTAAVTTDGMDATDRLLELIAATRFRRMVHAVFLNGVTMAGFNIVDLDRLHEETGHPVVAVVRKEPDHAATERAIRTHTKDPEGRLEVLRRQRPVATRNGAFRVWCSVRGFTKDELPALLSTATVRGAIPEPIRLAHVIASGLARGHSRGPA